MNEQALIEHLLDVIEHEIAAATAVGAAKGNKHLSCGNIPLDRGKPEGAGQSAGTV